MLAGSDIEGSIDSDFDGYESDETNSEGTASESIDNSRNPFNSGSQIMSFSSTNPFVQHRNLEEKDDEHYRQTYENGQHDSIEAEPAGISAFDFDSLKLFI